MRILRALLVPILLVMSIHAASAESQWIKNFKKGREAFEKDQYGKAIPYFKKAADLEPGDGDLFRWLGIAYFRNGQFQEAVAACEQALSLPHYKRWEYQSWEYLAFAQAALGQFASAVSSQNKALELNATNPDSFTYLAVYLWRNEQNDEAITTAKWVIELKPDSYPGYVILGGAYFNKQLYDEAIEAFDKAISINPKDPWGTYGEWGLCYYSKDDYVKAVWGLNKYAETHPSEPSVLNRVATSYFRLGDYGRAIEAANKAIELQAEKGDSAEKRYRDSEGASWSLAIRALSRRKNGNLEESLRDAEQAYSLDSAKDSWATVSLGAAYLDLGRFDEAIDVLPADGIMDSLLKATAYAKQGKMKEAAELYRSISEWKLSPKRVPLTADRTALLEIFKPSVRERRNMAKSFEAKKLYKNALSELTEALKMADEAEAQAILEAIFGIVRKTPSLGEPPEEATRRVIRAELLIKEASFNKAAREYWEAIQIAPYVAQLYYNSALIHAQLKRYPEAICQMKIYLMAAPDAPDAQAVKYEIAKWELAIEREKDR
jgi:tetratricopeptide (TPR) repeat protein